MTLQCDAAQCVCSQRFSSLTVLESSPRHINCSPHGSRWNLHSQKLEGNVMKTTIVAISLTGTLALLITSASEAQQPATTNRTNQAQPGRPANEQLGVLDDQTRG